MKRAGISFLAVIFVLCAFAPCAFAPCAFALRVSALQTTGVLYGTVINGTAGGGLVADLGVTVHVFQGQQESATLETLTDSQGHFEFPDLQVGQEGAYRVRVVYQGVAYSTGLLAFEPGQRELATELAVYEPTTSDENISVSRAHIFVATSGSDLRISELYVFENSGDRTYVGKQDTLERQPTSSFLLPRSSHSLTFDDGALGGRFQPIEGGFADTEPHWPGTTRVLYSYALDCTAGACDLSRTILYPVSILNLLVTDAGVRIESGRLDFEGKQETEGQRYLHYSAQDLMQDERLELVARLPQVDVAPAASAKSSPSSLPWIILGSVVAVLVLIYPFWRQRIRDSALSEQGASKESLNTPDQGASQ